MLSAASAWSCPFSFEFGDPVRIYGCGQIARVVRHVEGGALAVHLDGGDEDKTPDARGGRLLRERDGARDIGVAERSERSGGGVAHDDGRAKLILMPCGCR